ncbi:MAG: dethiobiotin synthase [Chthoniobacterales bacterium]|jgi:dethiobiotin synthetase
MNYLVTGTDTGVGKTFVTCGLIQAGRALGKQCVGMKPFCTGDLEDVEKIAAANGYLLPQHRVNPIWFRAPLAPYAAAMVENRIVDVQGVKETYSVLAKEFESVVVEGAGGLLVPILDHYDFRDLAVEWELGVVLVVANRLGALNHTLLTIEAIRKRGLPLKAVILNHVDDSESLAQQTNPGMLTHLLSTPPICLAYGQTDFGEVMQALGWL